MTGRNVSKASNALALRNNNDIEQVPIFVHAPDPEILLTDWLNALMYVMATRKMLFSRFEVCIEDDRLHAHAWGEPVNRLRHQPVVEIKGATYTELAVTHDETGWIAQCVVDV